MAENTKIEWADHTLVASETGQIDTVDKPVARFADGHAIAQVKPKLGITRPRLDVVRVEISTPVVTAVNAREPVSGLHVKGPLLRLWPGASGHALGVPPVNVRMARRPARRALSGSRADLCSCFRRVLFAKAIARTRLCRRAHFGAARGGHFAAFTHIRSIHHG